MEREKIYGCFTRDENEYQVFITLPKSVAEFYQVERQWEVSVSIEEGEEDLGWAAVELVEEQASWELSAEVYSSFCQYLEDDRHWSGELEEAEYLEGEAAAEKVRMEMYLSGLSGKNRADLTKILLS